MSDQLLGVVIGGMIALVGGISMTYLVAWQTNRRRAKSIRVIAKAEVTSIRDKVQRYLDGGSPQVLSASTPMLTSIAPELGFLTAEQAVAFRQVVTLTMEIQQEPSQAKAELTPTACENALGVLTK